MPPTQPLQHRIMREDEVCQRADKLLAKLMQLDALATSQMQRREFKDAREYLQRALDTGSDTALQLGSYHFAVISGHVREVQEEKRKGIERTRRREKRESPKASN